jgi:hypothetical protein
MMKWTLISLGIYLALQGFNLFLPKRLKERINEAHYRAWFVVARWKERIKSDWLFEPRFRVWFALAAIAISIIIGVLDIVLWFPDFQERGWYNLLFYGVAIPIGAALGLGLLEWIVGMARLPSK